MARERSGLRERTRRAVQREIAEAAERLFIAHGYEATTIDAIAAEVGMSQRSVFRYFPTKEDIVIGKLALGVADLPEIVGERGVDESDWAALTALFVLVGGRVDERRDTAAVEDLLRVIIDAPMLLARYLKLLDELAGSLAGALARRADVEVDVTRQAVAAAACSCFVAAQREWLLDTSQQFADVVEATFQKMTAGIRDVR